MGDGTRSVPATLLPVTDGVSHGSRGDAAHTIPFIVLAAKRITAIAEEDVAAAGVVGIHLIDIAKIAVRRMDDGRKLVDAGAGVDVDLRGSAVAVDERKLERGAGDRAVDDATQVELLCVGVCSPKKTVFDRPSVMSAIRVRLLRYSGPSAIVERSRAGSSQTSSLPALAT